MFVRIWGCGDSYFSFLFILRGTFSYWVVSYFNRHILRLGGFHSLSCLLSSIGKLWADGYLRDLLVDSGVYARNTAELMLVGKNLTGMSGGSHLYWSPTQHSYTGVGPLTTSIKHHQRSGMRCLNFIEISVIRRLKH